MTTDNIPNTSAIHPAEISSREFPRARKGLDPASVLSWLRTVERAYATLDAECRDLRAEKARVTAALQAARDGRSSTQIRVALSNAGLTVRRRGYDPKQVDELLSAAAAELARLETKVAALEAERAAVQDAASLKERLAEIEQRLASLDGSGHGQPTPPVASVPSHRSA